MSASVVISPNPATPGSTVTVEGAGFTPKLKTRIKDAGDVWRSRADGGFSVGLVVSTTPRTQAVVVQQQISGAWVTAWSGTVVVQASAPPPPIPGPEPPPSGTVGQFPGSGANTKAAFQAKLADMSIDVLEVAGGAYSGWHNVRINVDRSSRPLLVRPAPGAAVLWDVGDTGWGNGLFYFGIDSLASDFTFDPVGTGGSFEIRGFSLRSAGLITTYYARRITVNGFKVRDCRATLVTSGGQTEHAIYVATDGTHRGSDLTFNNWDFATGSDRKVNFFQCYHTPGADRIVARNNKVNGNIGGGRCHWALVARGDYKGLDISGWQIANVDVPFDSWDGGSGSPGQPTGVVSGMTATGSGAPRLGQIVDGGGSSW